MLSKDKMYLYGMLTTGIAVQIITFAIAPDNPWSLVSGILGICSVVLCSQGNIWTFLFGFGQIITYTYLCYLERFYAGIAMNAFYFISQIYGIFSWHKRLTTPTTRETKATHIQTSRLSVPTLIVLLTLTIGTSILTGSLLHRYTTDTQPYLDAFTTVPAIVAQVLMVLAYREQWYIWLFIDILYVLLWIRADNYSMTAQYIFWCINCVYGFVHWTKQSRPTSTTPTNT